MNPQILFLIFESEEKKKGYIISRLPFLLLLFLLLSPPFISLPFFFGWSYCLNMTCLNFMVVFWWKPRKWRNRNMNNEKKKWKKKKWKERWWWWWVVYKKKTDTHTHTHKENTKQHKRQEQKKTKQFDTYLQSFVLWGNEDPSSCQPNENKKKMEWNGMKHRDQER